MLEAAQYEDNCFATLTYNDKHLPKDGNVSKRELQLFMKKLRFHYENKIRFFAVGEYGERENRPHYHVMLFDFPTCMWGISRQRKTCCAVCSFVANIWGKGHVLLGSVTPDSAAYVSNYVTKGWWLEKELDREPEFTLKSMRPGIGDGFAHEIASVLLEKNATCVPRSIRHNGYHWPLGAYMLDKVSKYTGGLPIAPLQEKEEMQALSELVYGDESIKPRQKAWAFREKLIQRSLPKAEARERQLRAQQRRKSVETKSVLTIKL